MNTISAMRNVSPLRPNAWSGTTPASAIAVILVLVGLGLALLLRRLGGRDATASQLEGA